MIVGFNGLIGSGKNAAADYLQQKYNFQRLSFADSLKDAVSVVFGWDREMLAGLTEEARNQRELVDSWWSKRLKIRGLTPRWVLQQWGTEVCRYGFHPDIWIASLERKIENNSFDIVIDDCRFQNEMNSIRKHDGILIRINRGELPEWYETACNQLNYLKEFGYETGYENQMKALYSDVHISEWGWVTEKFDYEITNNGSLEDLHLKLDELLLNRKIIA